MVDQNIEPHQSGPGSDLPEQLPSDLKVAVSPDNQPKTTPIVPSFGQRAAESLPSAKVTIAPGMIIGAVVFAVLLLAGTAYLLLGQVGIGVNRGTLKLTLDPAGANIVIDGKFKRQSVGSLSIKLTAGEHSLGVTKEGYLDWEQDFTLVAGDSKEVTLKLEPIPNVEVLVEGDTVWPEMIRNGKSVAYLTAEGNFAVVNLSDKEPAALFGDRDIAQVRSVNWAPGEPMALVKINGTPKLSNMYDNRGVRGRFVPLGERPVQGAPRDTGSSSWFLDDTRQTAAGWQPVLLNESIGDFDFSPDSSRIIYFYHTADGEQSLIVSHPEGGEWERLATQVSLINPDLVWLNTDRYVLVLDDQGDSPDQVFDLVSKNLSEVMSDRMAGTAMASSPDGTRILYVSDENGRRLAVWNLLSGSREKLFDKEIGAATQFVWQTDNKFILSKDDGSLWYWDLNGIERPVQFISAVGALQPIKLFYSIVNHQLLVVEQSRILSLKA